MARTWAWVPSIFFFYEKKNTRFSIAFKTFEEWNSFPEIANAARELYGDIDRLELYPGLHAEGHAEDGYGQKYNTFRVNTVRFGLLFDAIALVCPFLSFCFLQS